MSNRPPKKRPSDRRPPAGSPAEVRADNPLRVAVDDWTVTLEWAGTGKLTASTERGEGFTLVHFDLPQGPLGEYQISVQQPFIDVYRSWAGAMDCWRGTELASIALNYSFETAANKQLPVICNYSRQGENRGVVGMLDQVPVTQVTQRPLIADQPPPMNILRTRFARARKNGGFRETVVLYREKLHFAEAVQRFLRFCRRRQEITPLPTPDWAREPVWCSWYSHLYSLTQRQVEEQIPFLSQLGFRTALIDASWFHPPELGCALGSGDYEVEESFFPDMLGLSRRLHNEGLKIMLWYAPFFMGEKTKKRKELEPYCALKGDERTARLCPFCEESIAHVRQSAERLMRDYQLDGLKVDFMDHISNCEDPKHDHGDGNEGEAVARLMSALRDTVLSVNPEAAIEYRVRYSTLVSQAFANCHRGNDAPYDADYMRRENLFLRLFCGYPSAVWNDYAYWHAREKPENVSLMLGEQIFSGGVPTVSKDLTLCSDGEREIIGRWLKFYLSHLEALARADLTVHTADSFFSVSSLQNAEKGVAFVLLAGQHIPTRIDLAPDIRRGWVLNASAENEGTVTLNSGTRSRPVDIAGLGLFQTEF